MDMNVIKIWNATESVFRLYKDLIISIKMVRSNLGNISHETDLK